MNCDILINLVDEFNETSAIAALKFIPKVIILAYDRLTGYAEDVEDLKDFIRGKLPDTDIIVKAIDMNSTSDINNLMKEYKGKNTVLNISSGDRFMSIISYQFALKHNISVIYIDILKKKIYELNSNTIEDITDDFIELMVEDYIACTGGSLISDATHFYEDGKIQSFIKYTIDNYEAWDKVKYVFRDNNIVNTVNDKPNIIILKTFGMRFGLRKELIRVLNRMVDMNILELSYISKYDIVLTFSKREYRSFLLVSGSWLEALTYKITKEIDFIDDVRSGVKFYWDEDTPYVKNEVDVIASYDSTLICISCKDTSNYDVDTLNELEIYAEQLGGSIAKKIIVSTKLPFYNGTLERAKEMDIHIVQFDGDINKLSNKLKQIITK